MELYVTSYKRSQFIADGAIVLILKRAFPWLNADEPIQLTLRHHEGLLVGIRHTADYMICEDMAKQAQAILDALQHFDRVELQLVAPKKEER